MVIWSLLSSRATTVSACVDLRTLFALWPKKLQQTSDPQYHLQFHAKQPVSVVVPGIETVLVVELGHLFCLKWIEFNTIISTQEAMED